MHLFYIDNGTRFKKGLDHDYSLPGRNKDLLLRLNDSKPQG